MYSSTHVPHIVSLPSPIGPVSRPMGSVSSPIWGTLATRPMEPVHDLAEPEEWLHHQASPSPTSTHHIFHQIFNSFSITRPKAILLSVTNMSSSSIATDSRRRSDRPSPARKQSHMMVPPTDSRRSIKRQHEDSESDASAQTSTKRKQSVIIPSDDESSDQSTHTTTTI
ncbi:uncharacterized protein MELLADRAFT_84260 [Melampsora larici-populina 98AG31]|uniref:Uncharacterized protein n=1 Tax=Melampsora larici-populina (strain 98AG31 / pathotype 3-4-7) TaxID=747676 RepID=F4RF31_MELLP|nr:uncharacterized protein MELLADRAFT_84260 [Melampsora larici-populina 98AG31]EGG09007.1 hypothetical protein MELLADRAFT_84260 [Melampsora larici-populina 98AG31]